MTWKGTELERVVASSQRLAERTRPMYLRRVQAFIEFVGVSPDCWTAYNLERWRDSLRERGLKPKTINLYMAAVSFASKRMADLQLGPNFARGAERMRVRAGDVTRGEPLSLAHARRLLKACNGKDAAALRDRAMILLALRTGFRRQEVVDVTFERVNGRQKTVTVIAKGGNLHTVEVDDEAWAALNVWIGWLRKHDIREGAVFRSLRPSCDPREPFYIGDSLSPMGFTKLLAGRGEAAKIGHVHPHQLRHTFTALALDAGVPMWRVQKVLGHRSPEMTMHYAPDKSGAIGAHLPPLDAS